MLESISIRNFQKHEQFTLDFDRITTICGPSDKGKSAIIRAIRWCVFNRPQGDYYIRHGSKGAEVVLQIDGHRISRRRGNKRNSYQLDDSCFSAFGNSIPDAIGQLVNISEDSFQLQHDPAYWLTLSPGQVAKELNRVINLELIDKCQGNISSELRRAKAEVEVSKNRLEEAKKEAETLAWVREANKSFQLINSWSEAINGKRIKLAKLTQIALEAKSYQRTIRNASITKPGAFLAKINGILDLKNRLNKLHDLNNCIGIAKEESCQRNMLLSKAKHQFAQSMKNQLCPICQQPLPPS